MNDGDAHERPARLRLLDMTADLRLGHARIMLERQRRDRLAGFCATADPGERDQGADVGAAARQRRGFRRRIELLALQPHGRLHQPPVIGGKNAISRAPAIAVSGRTWLLSMAARIDFGCSNAWAYSSPRSPSQRINSATVFTAAGGTSSSSALPIRSRTRAKYTSFISQSYAGHRHACSPSRCKA